MRKLIAALAVAMTAAVMLPAPAAAQTTPSYGVTCSDDDGTGSARSQGALVTATWSGTSGQGGTVTLTLPDLPAQTFAHTVASGSAGGTQTWNMGVRRDSRIRVVFDFTGHTSRGVETSCTFVPAAVDPGVNWQAATLAVTGDTAGAASVRVRYTVSPQTMTCTVTRQSGDAQLDATTDTTGTERAATLTFTSAGTTVLRATCGQLTDDIAVTVTAATAPPPVVEPTDDVLVDAVNALAPILSRIEARLIEIDGEVTSADFYLQQMDPKLDSMEGALIDVEAAIREVETMTATLVAGDARRQSQLAQTLVRVAQIEQDQALALNQSRHQTHALLVLVAVMFAMWLRPIFRSRREVT